MRFEYLEPGSIQHTVKLLEKYGGRAKVIAGGTDLMNQIRLRTVKPQYVVDIASIPELSYIRYHEDASLSIGAATTIRAIEMSPEIRENHPLISYAAGQLGSVAIRNVGTIGGNLCNAAPSADMAPALIALEARVKTLGPGGEREVFLEDFFTGPGKTILQAGEVLVEIRVPPLDQDGFGVYIKHSNKGIADLAVVGVASYAVVRGAFCERVRIVLGAVGPTPLRARKAEALLERKRVEEHLIKAAADVASEECSPISDARASAEYRRDMVKTFVRQALERVFKRELGEQDLF